MKHSQPGRFAGLSLLIVLGLVASCTGSKPAQQDPQPSTQKPGGTTPGGEATTDGGADAQSGGQLPAADAGGEQGTINASGGEQGTINAGGGEEGKINAGGEGATSGTAGAGGKINGNGNQGSGGTSTATGTTTAGANGKHGPWKPVPAGYNEAMLNGWVTAHQAKGAGFKYAYVPPALAANAETANVMRVALGKAWNHLHWKPEIDVPEDISEGAGLAFALNATKIWGAQAETNWGYIANCTPKGNIDISPAPRGACDTFGATEPVSIPRFVFNATNGGPYASVHQTPGNYSAFRNTFDLGPIRYSSTHKEAIVCGPRITSYRQVNLKNPPMTLWYSFSSDEFDGRDNGDINYQSAPTDNDMRSTGAVNAGPGDGSTAIASEWWMQLPNGFLYWGIHGEGSQERGKAEFPFAIDPANWRQDNELATGRSCITCHAAGIQSAHSDDTFAGKNGWTSNEELTTFYTSVREKFQGGMKTLVAGLSDGSDDLNARMINGTIEVISKAIREIEGGYTGGNDCSFFCNGKYGPQRQNLCEKLPTK